MNNYFKSFAIALITTCILTACGGCGGGGSNSGGNSQVTSAIPFQEGPPPSTDQVSKAKKRISSMLPNLFAPKLDLKLDLYTATDMIQPSSLPDKSGLNRDIIVPPIHNSTSFYTPVSGGVFVDKEVSSVHWFSYKFKAAPGFGVSLVWQVARHPFTGMKGNDTKNPSGLVKTGTLAAHSEGEFSIDFKEDLVITPGPTIKPISRPRQTYYVRVFPVDIFGNAVGDPGEGVKIVYGKQTVNPFVASGSPMTPVFWLWTPVRIMGSTYDSPEQPCEDYPALRAVVDVEPKDAPISVPINDTVSCSTRLFSIIDLDTEVNRVIFQVSDRAFDESSVWNNSKNIIYEKSYNVPIDIDDLHLPIDYTINNDVINGAFYGHSLNPDTANPAFFDKEKCRKSILLDFVEFGKKWTQMTEDAIINYYVRAIAIKKSSQLGTSVASYSNTVKINYVWKKMRDYTLPPPPPVPVEDRIGVVIPEVRIKSYTPIKWEDFYYMNHYIAFRAPLADEINCKYKNQNGDILYPFDLGKLIGAYDTSVTKEIYQANIIPQFITQGTSVYFPPPAPKKEDDSFWGELWDLATGFFTNLFNAFSSMYTAVQAAYENVKKDIIQFVVDLCPVDSLKGAFNLALTGLVNSALMFAGVPPTIPNFDQLIDGNLEYLAEYALTEAGVPAADIAAEVAVAVASEMREQITASTNHEDPNPAAAPFLKLDPAYMYRPAYLEVEIKNPSSTVHSAPGSFDINTTFEFGFWDYADDTYASGISLTCYNQTGLSWTDATSEYSHHFYVDLNGSTCDVRDPANSGVTMAYDVFNPVIGWKFPILRPNETKVVRIYLSEYLGVMTRYPSGDRQLEEDFYNIYFNGGNHGYGSNNKILTHFYLNTTIITPEDYNALQNVSYTPTAPNAKPIYDNKYPGPRINDHCNEPTTQPWAH
jgi:hypothetical protein